MAVRQIDRPQRSALGFYPVGQLRCLRVAEKGIDQQRITLTPDESDGVHAAGQRLVAGGTPWVALPRCLMKSSQ